MVVIADLRSATRERPGSTGGRPGFDSPDPDVRRAMTMLDMARANEHRQNAGRARALQYSNNGQRVPSVRERAMQGVADREGRPVTWRAGRGTKTTNPQVVCTDMWTPEEFRTFRHLVERCMSPRLTERAEADVWLRRFKEKHGQDKCQMMMDEIRRLDEVAWFKRKKEELKGY